MGPGKAYSKPFRHVSLLPRAGVYRRWRHHRRLCFGPWRFLQAFFFLIGASERFIVLRTCPGYSQSLLVGFQTEITPFSSIDGVGHQSLSLGKTLSVLSLSLSIESPRCQDLLVWSFFLFFKKFFLQFTLCSFCLSSTRNRYSLFHLYVKLYFVFLFMFVGCFSPQYIYPQKRTHVYPWILTLLTYLCR